MEDQNEHQDGTEEPTEHDSVESSVFRVLDASRKSAFEEDNATRIESRPSFDVTDPIDDSRISRSQDDFASDFADPSLLYRGPAEPAQAEQVEQEDTLEEHEDEHASFDDVTESASEAEEFTVIEAAPEELVEESEAPGLPARAEGGKPVLCLMGEFSAGKSTLSNLLIKTAALPVNVTATQLPPVWISKGNSAPYRVNHDGREFEIELEKLEEVSVEDTAFIRIFHDAELLDHCDLIDMPGISDPNMDADVWERVIPYADAVIWCTHATQAWRQSEAAVWSMLPPALYANSFLLLTRMDKILSDRDRMRVAKRVGRETVGQFRELFPISLTRALAAEGDAEKWAASGAEDFTNALHQLLAEIGERKSEYALAHAPTAPEEPAKYVMPSRVQPKKLLARRPTSRPTSAPAPLPPL
ncbi:dynamin family protein [Boseongicola aestuarii]|uniref:GTPase Era n=1 Tax=Boseongicola aestuarii TaxID=1470561 RepID=A0A238J017_9RHOB|nr:dynamin family protein [Boseongicola aestuarii]SMX23330.1 GTPase Era [Boseongicola aestuarii]